MTDPSGSASDRAPLLNGEDLGSKVRRLRREKRWTQRELAEALGLLSQGYISDVEAGKKTPTIEHVVALASLFSVSTDYLLRADATRTTMQD